MPVPEVGLAQRRPRMFRDHQALQYRVVGEDQLPVSTAADIDFDRVGNPGRGVDAGEGVVGVSGRPAPVPDDCRGRDHRESSEENRLQATRPTLSFVPENHRSREF
jgi:hypothetical protein